MRFIFRILVLSWLIAIGSVALAQGAVVIGKTNDPVYSDLVRLADGRVLACKPELEMRNGVLSRVCREDDPAAFALDGGAGLGALGVIIGIGAIVVSDGT